jgi:hypothetical protein
MQGYKMLVHVLLCLNDALFLAATTTIDVALHPRLRLLGLIEEAKSRVYGGIGQFR